MIALWLGFVGCVGVEPMARPEPEICDDGIDNDGDGAVDCDDEACGGLPCQQDQGPGDTGPSTEPIEIVIDSSECCEFSFLPENCMNRTAGSFEIFNRTDDEGMVDVIRCDPLDDIGSPVRFRTSSSSEPVDFLAGVVIPPQSSVTIEAVFDCQVDEAFESICESRASAGVFMDSRGFLVRGRVGL